jgi:hypothetical protein
MILTRLANALATSIKGIQLLIENTININKVPRNLKINIKFYFFIRETSSEYLNFKRKIHFIRRLIFFY